MGTARRRGEELGERKRSFSSVHEERKRSRAHIEDEAAHRGEPSGAHLSLVYQRKGGAWERRGVIPEGQLMWTGRLIRRG